MTISQYILQIGNTSHPENDGTLEASQALTVQAKVYAARMRLQSSVDQALHPGGDPRDRCKPDGI